jgi:O-antigen ligase
MTAFAFDHTRHCASAHGSARALCYGFVWLTFAASGLVLFEPAPVDALAMGLVLLLPMVGLMRVTPSLMVYLALWLVVTSAQMLAATQAPDIARAAVHTAISLQLILVSFVVAGFIADAPLRHTPLILNAWLVAAALAATAGIAGYFGLTAGAEELFTRHERATGTFKDPNVFGPFLIVPLLYVLHLALTRPLLTALTSAVVGIVLTVGLLLSFSRGAWACLLASVTIWCVITCTLGSALERRKLFSVCLVGALLGAVLLAIALQFDEVARLIEMRASLSQSYDLGPDGRFGGQLKALALIAESPLGIGSLAFVPLHHHEEAHNVYLSMGLYAGWLGGGVYLVLVVLTLAVGFARLPRSGAMRPYLTIALAAFATTALEGLIIDSDHWRHFYVQMALIWGLVTAAPTTAGHTA